MGRSLTLDGDPHTVVGVMPAGFQFPAGTTHLWRLATHAGIDPAQRRSHNWLVGGRLEDGATLAGAGAELSTLAASLAVEYVALRAAWVPARRATRIDPLRAVREEL